jgi:hypothetical protein
MWFKLTMILEGVLWLVGVWFITMQIVVPGIKGAPFFPILRRAPRAAEQKLAAATEAAIVDETLRAADTVAPKFKGSTNATGLIDLLTAKTAVLAPLAQKGTRLRSKRGQSVCGLLLRAGNKLRPIERAVYAAVRAIGFDHPVRDELLQSVQNQIARDFSPRAAE